MTNTKTMNTKERRARRQERLIALLNTHFEDNQARFAATAGIPATLVSRYVNGLKGIGEDMRNKIETNTGYIGWFDGDPSSHITHQLGPTQESGAQTIQSKSRTIALAPPAVTLDLDADCLLVWQQRQQLTPNERERWRAELDIAAGQARLAKLASSKKPEKPATHGKSDSTNPKARDPA